MFVRSFVGGTLDEVGGSGSEYIVNCACKARWSEPRTLLGKRPMLASSGFVSKRLLPPNIRTDALKMSVLNVKHVCVKCPLNLKQST